MSNEIVTLVRDSVHGAAALGFEQLLFAIMSKAELHDRRPADHWPIQLVHENLQVAATGNFHGSLQEAEYFAFIREHVRRPTYQIQQTADVPFPDQFLAFLCEFAVGVAVTPVFILWLFIVVFVGKKGSRHRNSFRDKLTQATLKNPGPWCFNNIQQTHGNPARYSSVGSADWALAWPLNLNSIERSSA